MKVANRFRRIFRKSPEKGKGKGKGKSDKTSCFIAGIKVSTSEGEKNIEDIKEGDWVWAYEEETGQKALKKVLSTSAVEAEQLIIIYIAEEEIQARPDHPFYVKGKGYTEAGKLHQGDSLLTLNNNYLVIDKLIRKDSTVKVYNFVVEDYHSYFVSSQSILVHNGGPCDLILASVTTNARTFKKWVKNNLTNKNKPLTDAQARELLDKSDKLGLLNGSHGRYTLQAETHLGDGSRYYDNVPHIHVFGQHIPVINPNFAY